jgi:hypothetical protein
MKQKLRILTVLFLLTALCHAQPRRERVRQMRVDYITKKLELTPSESEKFWPVYNEYTDKVRLLKRNLRQAFWQRSGELDDRKAADLVKLEGDSKQREADLYREYSDRLKPLIGIRRVAMLHIAEAEFRNEMIDVLRGPGGKGEIDN